MLITKHQKPLTPHELQLLTYLDSRMLLSSSDRANLRNLEKGYEGERLFFELLKEKIHGEYISLYDLLLESNQSEFQIDHLLVLDNKIILNEIKNFEGDFYVKENQWYVVPSKKEIRNPLQQLQRSELLLRNLLHQIGAPFQIEAYLIFVNPEFTLYQAPYTKSIVFPTQLNRYMQELNSRTTRLNSAHMNVAKELVSRHLPEFTRNRQLEYHYEQLQKGVMCGFCRKLLVSSSKLKIICSKCGEKETIESAIKRSVKEFSFLFPERLITITELHDWVNGITSKKVIRSILTNNLTLIRKGRSSYYIYDS
ncbi:nuclease-related domain-containing protein [Pseudogracilibacillus sp. SE30717A]|uniref:nuclease-related domain-containing protein n=1 Tax=Pseudogracilibacillus sp. SE30717A TaxID=3098293 RepID=UPI00300DE0E0